MKRKIYALVLTFFCIFCMFAFFGCNENIIDHRIIVTSSNIRYGTAHGDGYYKTKQQVVLTATELEGHKFVCWVKDDVIISTESEYKFVANKKTEGKYMAVFEGEQMQIEKLSNITLLLGAKENSGNYQLENVTILHSDNNLYNGEQSAIFDFDSPAPVQLDIQTDKIFCLDNQYYFSISLVIKNSLDQQKTYSANFIVTVTENDLLATSEDKMYSVQKTFFTTDVNLEISVSFNFAPLAATE